MGKNLVLAILIKLNSKDNDGISQARSKDTILIGNVCMCRDTLRTTDQGLIDAFIRGARAAEEDRRNSPRVNTDALAKLYSSAASADSLSHYGKESCSCDSYKAKR